LSENITKFFKFIDFAKKVENLGHQINNIKNSDQIKQEVENFIMNECSEFLKDDFGIEKISKIK